MGWLFRGGFFKMHFVENSHVSSHRRQMDYTECIISNIDRLQFWAWVPYKAIFHICLQFQQNNTHTQRRGDAIMSSLSSTYPLK